MNYLGEPMNTTKNSTSLWALWFRGAAANSVLTCWLDGPTGWSTVLQRMTDGGDQASDLGPQQASIHRGGLTLMTTAGTYIEANR